jgi:hypothetical protein
MTTTPCYLTVLSHLTKNQIAQLTPIIEFLDPDDPDVAEALGENSVIRFDAIFEGDTPSELLQWFHTNNVSFTWEWEAYYSVGAGCNYFDAEADEMHHIRLHETLAVLSVAEAIDPEKVKKLRTVMNAITQKRHDVGLA